LRGRFFVPLGVPCLLAAALLSIPVPALADGPFQAEPQSSVAAAAPRSGTPDARSKPADTTPGQAAKQDPVGSPARPRPVEDKRIGRALLEGGALLTVSATSYWLRYSAFAEDWQFELNWHDQRRKFFTSEGTRFDSNRYRTNWPHAWAGATYYSLARTNRLSTAESFLYTAAGSLIWEYVAEWREVSSINDHIITSAGGMAIGETLFQVGSYFRNRPGAANRIFTLVSNPILALNDALDGSKRPPRVPVDGDHDFRFSFGGQSGALTADNRRPGRSAFTLDMRVVTLPGYGAVGEGRGYTGRTIDSGVRVDLHPADGSVGEFTIRTRSTLFGWWWKRVGGDERGRRHGYDLWLGGGTAWDVWQKPPIVPYDGNDFGKIYRWVEREQPTRYADKVSSVHLPGPTFCLTRYDGPVRTRVDLQATVDFGMVNSLAFNRYSGEHDIEGVKTTLHNWGYYYAFGSTMAGKLEVQAGPVLGAARLEHRRFASVDGLDRYQEYVTDDSRLHDSRVTAGIDVTVLIPRTPAFTFLGVERIERRGRFHDVEERSRETRVTWQLGVRF
jgi:hypothetical protein